MAITKQELVVQRLPTSYVRGIGRVISRWAYLEWLLARIAYETLGVDPKQGRIAVREPRADEYIRMIQDLLTVKNLTVPLPDPGLKKRLEKARENRDHLAHGLWVRHRQTGELRVRLTKGNWPPLSAGGATGPRKIAPAAIRKAPADLTAAYREIDHLISLLRRFEMAILRALASSRGKSP